MFISKQEAAAVACCSERQIDRLRAAGKLRAVKTPGGLRFEKADVAALVTPLAPRQSLFGTARSVDDEADDAGLRRFVGA